MTASSLNGESQATQTPGWADQPLVGAHVDISPRRQSWARSEETWRSELRPDEHAQLVQSVPAGDDEFEASGIDDHSLAELLSRLGQATTALRERVEAVRHDLREAESEAAAVRERTEEAENSLRQLNHLCHETELQAQATVATARAEADELRSRARSVFADARNGVATLNARRDAIVRELTGLSGIIEALAVDGSQHNRVRDFRSEPLQSVRQSGSSYPVPAAVVGRPPLPNSASR